MKTPNHKYPPHIDWPPKTYKVIPKPPHLKTEGIYKEFPCCYRECPGSFKNTPSLEWYQNRPPVSCGCSRRPYKIPRSHLPILSPDPQPYRDDQGVQFAKYICNIPSGDGLCGTVFYSISPGMYDPDKRINTLRTRPRSFSCGCLKGNRKNFWVIPFEWRHDIVVEQMMDGVGVGALPSPYQGIASSARGDVKTAPCRMPGCPRTRTVSPIGDARGWTHLSCGCSKWRVKVPQECLPTYVGEPSIIQMDVFRTKHKNRLKRKPPYHYDYALYQCNIVYNDGKKCGEHFVAVRPCRASSCGCVYRERFRIPYAWRIEPEK